jgi:predicted MFS family arabinose efflux permease
MTEYVSWRQVFLAAGIVSLVLAVCIWLWVRDDPYDAGLAERIEAPRAPGGWWDGVIRVAGNRDTWPGFFMHLGMIGSYLTFAGLWAVPYLTDGLGLARPTATLHVTLMILGLALGSFAVGTLSDRMGRRLPLVRVLAVLYLVAWLPWVLGWRLPLPLSLAASALMGIGISGASLAWALAKGAEPARARRHRDERGEHSRLHRHRALPADGRLGSRSCRCGKRARCVPRRRRAAGGNRVLRRRRRVPGSRDALPQRLRRAAPRGA